jgi:hypothetical protein
MATDEQYWESVANGRKEIKSLLVRSEKARDALPEMRRLDRQRERATRFLGQPKFKRRLLSIYEACDSRTQPFYENHRLLAGEVLAALEQLRNVLPHDEVESLKREISPIGVVATHKALRRAAQRLDEFWECRPADETPRSSGSRESRLQQFVKRHKTTIAAVVRAASVHKPEMQKWRHGELADTSVMSQRIENVLAGKTPLKLARGRPQLS